MRRSSNFSGLYLRMNMVLAIVLRTTVSSAGSETVIHSFGNGMDGGQPIASLIDVNGILYGTTYYGGTSNYGTIFSLDPTTGAENVLHSFGPAPDGQWPAASLVDVGGALYGTTYGGGTRTTGAIFSVNLTTGKETVVSSFCRKEECKQGQYPETALIQANGVLYGTTYDGGPLNGGTVFSFDPVTRARHVVYSFCSLQGCADGAAPLGSLINVKNTIYGTAAGGGAEACFCGVVFALNPKTGTEKVLHSFSDSPDGSTPLAGLIDLEGTLYGTTNLGGDSRYGCGAQGSTYGVVFSLVLADDKEKVLWSFGHRPGCKDGMNPYAELVDVNGTLYGTTYFGGDEGTVFALNRKTGALKVLHRFCSEQNCADGKNPRAALINVDGTLYGTTQFGGAYGGGTVFAVTR